MATLSEKMADVQEISKFTNAQLCAGVDQMHLTLPKATVALIRREIARRKANLKREFAELEFLDGSIHAAQRRSR